MVFVSEGWDFHLDEATGELAVTTPTGRTHTTRPGTILEPNVGKTDESNKDDPRADTDDPSC
ncbi:hypothetical protein Atai01_64950 [Amycolatopsis taiwanensis]|uniref:Uncharacterized protein n=1 Tax=Amycolatopsis taiwanensis TaxID=342230 RepID=A0A9W6VKV7_9PSEU|nr:hypothetical protein Atai01_64950 [Amycolatopsis taiwanensis]